MVDYDLIEDAIADASPGELPQVLADLAPRLEASVRSVAFALERAYLAGARSAKVLDGAPSRRSGMFTLEELPHEVRDSFGRVRMIFRAAMGDDEVCPFVLAPAQRKDDTPCFRIILPERHLIALWSTDEVDALTDLGLLTVICDGLRSLSVRGRMLALRDWSSWDVPATADETWGR